MKNFFHNRISNLNQRDAEDLSLVIYNLSFFICYVVIWILGAYYYSNLKLNSTPYYISTGELDDLLSFSPVFFCSLHIGFLFVIGITRSLYELPGKKLIAFEIYIYIAATIFLLGLGLFFGANVVLVFIRGIC